MIFMITDQWFMMTRRSRTQMHLTMRITFLSVIAARNERLGLE
jgi:hypothetical protein